MSEGPRVFGCISARFWLWSAIRCDRRTPNTATLLPRALLCHHSGIPVVSPVAPPPEGTPFSGIGTHPQPRERYPEGGGWCIFSAVPRREESSRTARTRCTTICARRWRLTGPTKCRREVSDWGTAGRCDLSWLGIQKISIWSE